MKSVLVKFLSDSFHCLFICAIMFTAITFNCFFAFTLHTFEEREVFFTIISSFQASTTVSTSDRIIPHNKQVWNQNMQYLRCTSVSPSSTETFEKVSNNSTIMSCSLASSRLTGTMLMRARGHKLDEKQVHSLQRTTGRV